jgi:hypothetical protein
MAPAKEAGGVFTDEAEMVSKMKAIGMTDAMLAKLSPEQRAQIFALASSPEILAKAQERVSRESSAAADLGVEGRSADGSATLVKGGMYSWKDEKAQAVVEVAVDATTLASDVVLVLTADRVSLAVKGVEVVAGELFQSVDPARCVHAIADGTLTLTLVKKTPMRWLQVTRK